MVVREDLATAADSVAELAQCVEMAGKVVGWACGPADTCSVVAEGNVVAEHTVAGIVAVQENAKRAAEVVDSEDIADMVAEDVVA